MTRPQQENAPRRSGWYRSPGGVLAHADGPSQVAAFEGRGYQAVDEAEAKREIGDGITLTVDRRDRVKGTFDAQDVARAVREEGSQEKAKAQARSDAAKKAAETKRRNREAAQAAQDRPLPPGAGPDTPVSDTP